jgi:NitT/TauT family transport system permease protein
MPTAILATGSRDERDPEIVPEEDRASTASRLGAWSRRWLVPLGLLAAAWELVSHYSGLNPALFPPIEVVAKTFWHLLLNGVLEHNAAGTLWRMFVGWGIAGVSGTIVGFLMARNRYLEELLVPIIGILMPIPSLAWIPFFILWFGLTNAAVVALVIFSSILPIILTVWTGTRTINPVWMRAARSLGIVGLPLFYKIILPASLPFVMTALRVGIAQAWRAVIAGEMFAGTSFGLGIMIFNARQYLRTDIMIASLLVIGPLGFLIEKVLFETIERKTIERWGMAGRA